MHYSVIEDLTWHYSKELDIYIGVEPNLPSNAQADIVYARLEPGATLKKHYHDRSDSGGYEAFFFYQGADIQLLLDGSQEKHIARDQPFHLTFFDDEVHGITNLAETPLHFEVLCAPRHVDGEEVVAD